MDIQSLYRIYSQYPVICTDTRKITAGCLFFALKGENFNANEFAAEAIRSGAAYAVIDEEACRESDRFILVPDVLTALQDLARYHRAQLSIPFIGITGTNGKTTTKELINSVLSQKYTTLATQGNLNNHIGVPLTVLSIGDEVELAVIEMGANHQKEIEFLCSIAQPTHGLITNVGKAHLEGFGGFEGVKRTKGELYQYLSATGGTVFIQSGNAHLIEMSRTANVENAVRYGQLDGDLVTGKLRSSDPFLVVEWSYPQETGFNAYVVSSNLTGTYNLENVLAAIAMGTWFKLSPEEINTGIESYHPSNNRSQIVETASNRLICDYYNANPGSMIVALDNLASLKGARKAMILGDMFELGDESDAEHKAVFEKAMSVSAERRIFVGEAFFKLSGTTADAVFYKTTPEAKEALEKQPIQGATILIKGSRGMKLEVLAGLL
ncbi:UDP-N-acetylmuramoyl-tripeptide--D-alanyl-D-alanine ligase [Pedobacter sp. HMF7056]|uniref:UDP-N-acetylmuramoyl-tripeptide--D-alanyl-D-alanine ligase n=2 Tax=Hufsiella ginkgonis TaxID=2695274 RepID=A0A7K1XTP9_9SPHI|nr:UDP-N-acetylmuramoyl-tripeptide--D-alanyl-D-alanine ligase [Hufsiella ginkgonis]MXV14352.1 UDP-N-acetylmuramoyl-tripeptide--D-alanyl-D-alanine ligase [Hufsiella ginkgonis]